MARIRNEGADVLANEYPCWIAHPYKLNTNSWICVLGFGEALMTNLTQLPPKLVKRCLKFSMLACDLM